MLSFGCIPKRSSLTYRTKPLEAFLTVHRPPPKQSSLDDSLGEEIMLHDNINMRQKHSIGAFTESHPMLLSPEPYIIFDNLLRDVEPSKWTQDDNNELLLLERGPRLEVDHAKSFLREGLLGYRHENASQFNDTKVTRHAEDPLEELRAGSNEILFDTSCGAVETTSVGHQ